MKKKLFSILMIAAVSALMLAGCGSSSSSSSASSASSASSEASGKTYKVAVVQTLDHPSLTQIRKATEKGLKDAAEEKGFNVEIKEFNGQNETSTLTAIGDKIVSGKYDAVIPIATLGAQVMQSKLKDTDTPIIFAAISDPVTAGLVKSLDKPGANITGTSDMLDADSVLDMIFKQQPDVKTVGLLYNKSEDSSKVPIEQAKKYLDKKGVKVIEKTGTNADEIKAAAESLAESVDAVFTPTDNTVAASELTVAKILTKNGVPHYTGADSFVRNGAFATRGVDYDDLGKVTGQMCADALTGADPATTPVHVMNGDIITVNTDTASALKLDYKGLKDLGSKLVEVKTSKD